MEYGWTVTRILFLAVFADVVTCQGGPLLAGAAERRFACWGSFGPPVVSAQCPRGTVVEVVRAGLKVQARGGRCVFREGDCGCEFGEAGCNMPDVTKLCSGRSACRLDVTQQYISTLRCQGFSDYMYIEFNCVKAEALPNLDTDICSNSVLTQESGYIHSPNYPHPYPDWQHCECTLTTPPFSSIILSILDFHVDDFRCKQDTLELTYGGRSSKLCGHSNGLTNNVNADTNMVQLKFTSDATGADDGFWIKYQAKPASQVTVNCSTTKHNEVQLESTVPGKVNGQRQSNGVSKTAYPYAYDKGMPINKVLLSNVAGHRKEGSERDFQNSVTTASKLSSAEALITKLLATHDDTSLVGRKPNITNPTTKSSHDHPHLADIEEKNKHNEGNRQENSFNQKPTNQDTGKLDSLPYLGSKEDMRDYGRMLKKKDSIEYGERRMTSKSQPEILNDYSHEDSFPLPQVHKYKPAKRISKEDGGYESTTLPWWWKFSVRSTTQSPTSAKAETTTVAPTTTTMRLSDLAAEYYYYADYGVDDSKENNNTKDENNFNTDFPFYSLDMLKELNNPKSPPQKTSAHVASSREALQAPASRHFPSPQRLPPLGNIPLEAESSREETNVEMAGIMGGDRIAQGLEPKKPTVKKLSKEQLKKLRLIRAQINIIKKQLNGVEEAKRIASEMEKEAESSVAEVTQTINELSPTLIPLHAKPVENTGVFGGPPVYSNGPGNRYEQYGGISPSGFTKAGDMGSGENRQNVYPNYPPNIGVAPYPGQQGSDHYPGYAGLSNVPNVPNMPNNQQPASPYGYDSAYPNNGNYRNGQQNMQYPNGYGQPGFGNRGFSNQGYNPNLNIQNPNLQGNFKNSDDTRFDSKVELEESLSDRISQLLSNNYEKLNNDVITTLQSNEANSTVAGNPNDKKEEKGVKSDRVKKTKDGTRRRKKVKVKKKRVRAKDQESDDAESPRRRKGERRRGGEEEDIDDYDEMQERGRRRKNGKDPIKRPRLRNREDSIDEREPVNRNILNERKTNIRNRLKDESPREDVLDNGDDMHGYERGQPMSRMPSSRNTVRNVYDPRRGQTDHASSGRPPIESDKDDWTLKMRAIYDSGARVKQPVSRMDSTLLPHPTYTHHFSPSPTPRYTDRVYQRITTPRSVTRDYQGSYRDGPYVNNGVNGRPRVIKSTVPGGTIGGDQLIVEEEGPSDLTVAIVAAGVIGVIIVVVVVGVIIRHISSKRERKNAMRQRHKRECAIRRTMQQRAAAMNQHQLQTQVPAPHKH